MSNYSHALKSIIDEAFEGRQLSLAEKCDVPHSLVSRHCSGEYRPDQESLEKICAAMSTPLRAKLAGAHLHDETPPSARNYVTIQTSDGGRAHTMSETPSAFERLDNKTRRAFEYLATIAMDSKDACEAIQSTAKYMGADLTRDAKPAAATSKRKYPREVPEDHDN